MNQTTEAKDKTDRRDIKFRAWDKSGKQMVSPDYITRDFCGFWQENSIPTMSKILMQFTGLRDKNGKEIYEGDIVERFRYVENNGGHKRSKIVFEDGRFKLSQTVNLTSKIIHNALVTVIGNIYENPELLSHERI